MLAQLAVAEAHGHEPEQEHDGEHGLDAGIAEAQRGGAHVVDHRGPMQVIEDFGSERTVVAETLDAQQVSVGCEADLVEIIEVFQQSAEVVAVVDDGPGAQRATHDDPMPIQNRNFRAKKVPSSLGGTIAARRKLRKSRQSSPD